MSSGPPHVISKKLNGIVYSNREINIKISVVRAQEMMNEIIVIVSVSDYDFLQCITGKSGNDFSQ